MTFTSAASGPSSSVAEDGPTEPKHVTILYASETGHAQDVAERVGREFRRLGRKCVILSMDTFDVFQLPDIPLLILIASTHGRGDPPPTMMPFWAALLRTSLPPDILEGVHFACYGLGDSSYERFCYAGKMLARRMEGLGAERMGEPVWGDERAPDGIEETFLPWLQQTLDLMLPYLPLSPSGHIPLSPTSLPAPIYILEEAIETQIGRLSLNGPSNGHTSKILHNGDSYPVNGHSQAAPTRSFDPGGSEIKPSDWVWACLTRNERITPKEWWQKVREIELEFEDSDLQGYAPGSVCELQPRTSTAEVDEFLEMMGLQEQADRTLRLRSAIPDQPLPSHLPSSHMTTTLRSLLTNHLNLRSSPRKSFFEWLRRLSPDEREQDRLDDFMSDPDEIHNYATRPSRTILETLADFRNTRIPMSHILEILPPLRRRQFSIASSSLAHEGKVQLLVALVEYKTNLKMIRKGLGSSWLESLPVGLRVPIKISPPTLYLPSDPSTPVILVGPGTGIAPMRAFVETRLQQGAAKDTMLYFGCRSASSDLFYASEWETYQRLGVRIRVAASRDQQDKVYVQHLIRRDKDLIKQWVADLNGNVYISGSSNAMPREVREALAWCISSDGAGDLDAEAAKAYIEDMFENGRGGEESW